MYVNIHAFNQGMFNRQVVYSTKVYDKEWRVVTTLNHMVRTSIEIDNTFLLCSNYKNVILYRLLDFKKLQNL